tara:strand:- start:9707 stop:10888 length:1182 start_codon:yes stop_codon:yes gene_type:complete
MITSLRLFDDGVIMQVKILAVFMAFVCSVSVHAASELETLSKKVDALSKEVVLLKMGGGSSWTDRISLGGYGEMTYTNNRSENESGAKVGGANPQVDALRHVLYVGYKFSDRWSMLSEIEIEHADEIYLEFAQLDYNFSKALNFRAGLLLTPVGIVNQMHEPATFVGVKRSDIESKIIPTTWREHGLGLFGESHNFEYQVYLMNSLNGDSFSSSGVRSGRQKGSQATARSLSYVARLDWKKLNWLTLGASAYVGKANSSSKDVGHNIFDGHALVNYKNLYARALYVHSSIDAKKLPVSQNVGEKLHGFYVELGYDVVPSELVVMPYVRREHYDTQDDVPAGVTNSKATKVENTVLGIMVKPLDNISFKADYTLQENDAKTGVDSFNLGMGWHF